MDKVIKHEHGRYKPVEWEQRPAPDDNWPYGHRPNSGHDPQYGVKSPKFEKHLFIRRDQIIFDVDSQIQMVASARRKPDGTEDDTMQQATQRFPDMFTRWISEHVGRAKSAMSAFVLEKVRHTAMNNIKDADETDITLLMPEWYDDTTFQQLSDAVHAYIVNGVLYSYFSLTLTSKDPVTLDKLSATAEQLMLVKKYVNAAKPGRISKPQKPF